MSTASANGELAETASSSGSQLRSALTTRMARSAPWMPTWAWKPNVLFFQTTYLKELVVAPVVRVCR